MNTDTNFTASGSLPRSEYPRPQYRRDQWLCLNGIWEFEIDLDDCGEQNGLRNRSLHQQIIVPFCPESKLSGIENTDYMPAVWYRRNIVVPENWQGRELLLHFQAVDYETTVWVNGILAGFHRGGFTPYTCNLGLVGTSQNYEIVLRARDSHDEIKPMGKQCPARENRGPRYTRTTGIWQTVWMEPVNTQYLKRPRITPVPLDNAFKVQVSLNQPAENCKIQAKLYSGKRLLLETQVTSGSMFTPEITLSIPDGEVRLWSPENPFLYDIILELADSENNLLDTVYTYAGMRGLVISGRGFYLNGNPLFQRLVLDQGYYPDGIMTAPSDEMLRNDIILSQKAGFNGARLHEKVFEERFLYHADQLGYLVWGEFADWHPEEKYVPVRGGSPLSFMHEWLEVLDRDYSHPCIIGWCPLNETHPAGLSMTKKEHDLFVSTMFRITKSTDSTRPVIDTSGYIHKVSEIDMIDSHNYCQDAEKLREQNQGLIHNRPFMNFGGKSCGYNGQPYFISEMGGMWWNPGELNDDKSWGYGDRPVNEEEFLQRFHDLCRAIMENSEICGFCYTQLTDVFQEQNGIYSFDRKPKFDLERIRIVLRATAFYEKKYRRNK